VTPMAGSKVAPSRLCALCDRPMPLVRSHILPEFFYEHAYDDTGRFVELDFGHRPKEKLHQVGLRQHLLCADCDGRIGRWESSAAQLLRRLAAAPVSSSGLIEVPDFEYSSFKLFGISLLWRFDITRLSFFSAVRLGPFGELAKRALLAGNPGPPHSLGFAIARSGAYDLLKTVVTPPQSLRYRGRRGYFFLSYGFIWAFVVSSDAHGLAGTFPFVGADPILRVPILEASQDAMLAYLRATMRPGLNRMQRRAR